MTDLFLLFSRTSLEAEKVRLSNQTQALELERANTKKYQDAVESERQRGKQENNRLLESMEALRRQLSGNKQEKADLEVQLERERIALSNLESELETEKALQGEALGKKILHFLFSAWFNTQLKASLHLPFSNIDSGSKGPDTYSVGIMIMIFCAIPTQCVYVLWKNFLNELLNLTFVLFSFSFLTTERDRETIEELSAALRDEKARAEHMQLSLTNEKRQTEALKYAKERADQLRNANKGKTMREMVAEGFIFQVKLLPTCCDTFLSC